MLHHDNSYPSSLTNFLCSQVRRYVIMSAIGALVYVLMIAAWVGVYQSQRAGWGALGDSISLHVPYGEPWIAEVSPVWLQSITWPWKRLLIGWLEVKMDVYWLQGERAGDVARVCVTQLTCTALDRASVWACNNDLWLVPFITRLDCWVWWTDSDLYIFVHTYNVVQTVCQFTDLRCLISVSEIILMAVNLNQ